MLTPKYPTFSEMTSAAPVVLAKIRGAADVTFNEMGKAIWVVQGYAQSVVIPETLSGPEDSPAHFTPQECQPQPYDEGRLVQKLEFLATPARGDGQGAGGYGVDWVWWLDLVNLVAEFVKRNFFSVSGVAMAKSDMPPEPPPAVDPPAPVKEEEEEKPKAEDKDDKKKPHAHGRHK